MSLDSIKKHLSKITFDMKDVVWKFAPVLVISGDGFIQAATGAVDRMFGQIEGALVGKHVNDLVPDRLRKNHEQHLARYFENPVAREMGAMPMELIAVNKDGKEFKVEITLNPFVADGPDGRTTYVAATIVKIRGQ